MQHQKEKDIVADLIKLYENPEFGLQTWQNAVKDKIVALIVIYGLNVSFYQAGYIDALNNYAIWKNGEQFIGVMARPLKEVIEEVKKSNVPIRY